MIGFVLVYIIIGIPWLIVGLVMYWEAPDRDAALVLVTAPIWPVALVVFVTRMFLEALTTLREQKER